MENGKLTPMAMQITKSVTADLKTIERCEVCPARRAVLQPTVAIFIHVLLSIHSIQSNLVQTSERVFTGSQQHIHPSIRPSVLQS